MGKEKKEDIFLPLLMQIVTIIFSFFIGVLLSDEANRIGLKFIRFIEENLVIIILFLAGITIIYLAIILVYFASDNKKTDGSDSKKEEEDNRKEEEKRQEEEENKRRENERRQKEEEGKRQKEEEDNRKEEEKRQEEEENKRQKEEEGKRHKEEESKRQKEEAGKEKYHSNSFFSLKVEEIISRIDVCHKRWESFKDSHPYVQIFRGFAEEFLVFNEKDHQRIYRKLAKMFHPDGDNSKKIDPEILKATFQKILDLYKDHSRFRFGKNM